jgi:GT2 family glycosyltransferase
MERHTQNPTIGIGIPTLNRFDLLEPNLLLYARDFNLEAGRTPFYILNNGEQDVHFNYAKILNFENNIGVAKSWNTMCDRIFYQDNCDYALILNDDIYLGKKMLDIIEIISKYPDKFIRSFADWSIFILPKSVYEKVGKFDECFYPAYYEDKSYEYRMKLMGVPMIKRPELNPYVYESSKTIEKDYSIFEASKKNKQKYIEIWGGEPEREKFKTPYNE